MKGSIYNHVTSVSIYDNKPGHQRCQLPFSTMSNASNLHGSITKQDKIAMTTANAPDKRRHDGQASSGFLAKTDIEIITTNNSNADSTGLQRPVK